VIVAESSGQTAVASVDWTPLIVILVLLVPLIIILILCCCYRRRQDMEAATAKGGGSASHDTNPQARGKIKMVAVGSRTTPDVAAESASSDGSHGSLQDRNLFVRGHPSGVETVIPASSVATVYESQFSNLAAKESHNQPFASTGGTPDESSPGWSFFPVAGLLDCAVARSDKDQTSSLRADIDTRRVKNLRDEVDFKV